ncbi:MULTISPECIES: hypothetical protein [unclassified Bradyrhizobium]|uniref:hypothetical protein n=1 Tax=unclassified Bradyrhizobium TaxID=2631580 RepID=UPI00339A4E32
MNTEADTCRKFVFPRLQTAGWEGAPHVINEQRTFTDDLDRAATAVRASSWSGKAMIWTPSDPPPVGSSVIF